MSIIATAVRHLMAAGVTGEALVQAIADMEESQPKDAAAERRRAWDRERKRSAKAAKSGGIPVESAESAEKVETDPLSLPPNENNSNPPAHSHPEHESRAREGNPFPRPAWCADQLWRDLRSNRKAKHLACTPTAHAKLLRDIEKYTDDDWPPGRVLEAAVARGWAAVPSDPRDDRKPRNERPANQHFSGNSTLQELAERSIAGG